ncbi:MAG: AI-2E family transporter [Clostridia bacterium]|nr:AI-2E family transporter [Clostridia bacterium]
MSLQMGVEPSICGTWVRRGIGWLLAGGVGLALIAVVWKPCLPFAAAFLFSAVIQKPYRRIVTWLGHHRHGKYRKAAAVGWRDTAANYTAAILLILGCVLVGGMAVWGFFYLLLSEIGQLFSWIGENGEIISGWVGRMMDSAFRLIDRLPLPKDMIGQELHASVIASVVHALPDMLGGLLTAVSAKASSAVTAIIAALPRFFLFFAVFLIASVYMTVSYGGVREYLQRCLPQKWRGTVSRIRAAFGGTVLSVLRAYLILSSITFLLLFIGLLLLGVEHGFGAAIVGTLIDILPVFGVGTLLIPWAIVSFLVGRAGRGVGLVVLYLVICFVRQALEPRLIGKTAGVHPLAVLFALYAGGILFGLAGMIVSPFLLTVIWRGYRMIGRDHHA